MRILDSKSQLIRARSLPGRKEEAWRYLNLKSLESAQFQSPSMGQPLSLDDEKQISQRLNHDCHHIVIWNGEFRSEMMEGFKPMPDGSFSGLGFSCELLASGGGREFDEHWHAEEKHFGLTTEFYDDYVQGLPRSGLLLRIGKVTRVEKPIQIILGCTAGAQEKVFSTDLWIEAEAGSKCELMVNRFSKDSANLFLGRVRLRVNEDAAVDLVQTQDLSMKDYEFFRTGVLVGKSAKFNSLVVQKGGKIARQNIDVIMAGENGFAEVNGLYFGRDEQICDHHTLIDHHASACTTRQLYKGILDHHARAVFDGRVRIGKSAVKASSEQLNKNLLLTTTAEADSKPQLEIATDDVKATHGSAVGQMAESELFYLESRGIAPERAREMLVRGFVDELVENIGSRPMKETVIKVIAGEWT